MGKVIKVAALNREHKDPMTFQGSLSRHGYQRAPGTVTFLTPHMEASTGKYRTGLDLEALYIRQMQNIDPEAAESERALIRGIREQIEELNGNLSDYEPNAPYYSQLYDDKMNTPQRASRIKITAEGPYSLNTSTLEGLLTYAWLRVSPEVAPSLAAYKEGRVRNAANVFFFLDNDDEQAEYEYKEKSEINKAISKNESLTEARRLKIATLLKLPVSYESKPSTVYSLVDTYIKDSSHKKKNVDMFNKVFNMKDDVLEVEYLVDQALFFNIYRMKNGRLMEGEVNIGASKDDLIDFLTLPQNQDDLTLLQEKVKQAKLRRQ